MNHFCKQRHLRGLQSANPLGNPSRCPAPCLQLSDFSKQGLRLSLTTGFGWILKSVLEISHFQVLSPFFIFICCLTKGEVLCLSSHVWLFETPRTAAHRAPLSMGILQARTLQWVAIPFSRGSSQPRDQTQVSHIAGGFLTIWAATETQEHCSG